MSIGVERGDVWYVDLSPARGHEQDGVRPCIVLSVRERLPVTAALVVPLTSRFRNLPAHVPVQPPEGGLRSRSYALCEQMRCVSFDRLQRRLGRVNEETLTQISLVLHYLMALQCPSPETVASFPRRFRRR